SAEHVEASAHDKALAARSAFVTRFDHPEPDAYEQGLVVELDAVLRVVGAMARTPVLDRLEAFPFGLRELPRHVVEVMRLDTRDLDDRGDVTIIVEQCLALADDLDRLPVVDVVLLPQPCGRNLGACDRQRGQSLAHRSRITEPERPEPLGTRPHRMTLLHSWS